MRNYLYTLLVFFLIQSSALAQPIEMATRLRAEGKIYIVIAVMLVIFLGVAVHLFSLDRRVKKLEKENQQ